MLATGDRFQQVAHAIRTKKVRTIYDPSAASGEKTAQYLLDVNVLYLTGLGVDTYSKSLIIHEAGHIINDIYRVQKVHVYDDEAFCYVIQAAYLTLKNFGIGNIETLRSASGRSVTQNAIDVFRSAYNLAGHYLSGGALLLQNEQNLRVAISRLPEYPTNKIKHYDGL